MSKQKEREDRLSTKGKTYLGISNSNTLILFIVTAKTIFLLYVTTSFPFVLSQESERLEMLNSDLKAQIEELKLERQQLILMLNRHRPTCIVRTDSVKTPESEVNPLLQQLEAK